MDGLILTPERAAEIGVPIFNAGEYQQDKMAFGKKLRDGFALNGFIAINGHNVTDDIIQTAYAGLQKFFDLPEDVKKKYIIPGVYGQRGYTAFGVEQAKDATVPDLKEFWHVGREFPEGHPLHGELLHNVWPEEVPEFKPALLGLYNALDQLSYTLLNALSLSLGLEESWFVDRVTKGNSVMRAIHYPPIDDLETPAVRAGAHEDIDLITLLVGANAPGLEIQHRDGHWIPVTAIEGTIMVNAGDMLQRWTNHEIPSTTHRVINPTGEQRTKPRFSVPLFVHPNRGVMIETFESCITPDNPNRYPEPISADDFLDQRLEEIKLK